MIIPAVRRESLSGPAGDEQAGIGPWYVYEIPETKIKIYGIEEPRPLKIHTGVNYRILNDDGWILKSISRELSSEIIEWPLLDSLDPHQEYILRADDGEGTVTFTSA